VQILAFLKKNWRWFLIGLIVIGLGSAIVIGWRVVTFVRATTGGGRTQGYLTANPTPPSGQTTITYNSDLFIPTPTATEPGFKLTIPPVSSLLPTEVALSGPSSSAALAASSSLVEKLKNGESLSLLLVGYGGNGHAGEWLTDTVMVMRYEPKTKTILQFNIPRDLYVFVPYGGQNSGKWAKLNTILASIMEWNKPDQSSLDPKYRWHNDQQKFDSGVNLLADTVELVLGIPIDQWATLSFEGFRRLIDAMGGVQIKVERSFIDYQYPRNDNDQIDASYITIQFQAGDQIMNGEQAIRYARSRHSETPLEGGDFARSRRQMRLISAVKEQVLKQNLLLKALDYMQALQGQIRFSLNFGELTNLANYLNSPEGKALSNQIKFSSEVLDGTYLVDSTINEDYVLLPKEGQGKYQAIQQWVQSRLANADIRREGVRVQVLNSNGKVGLAGQITDFLLDHGFRTSDSQDGEDQAQTELVDYTAGAAPNTVARLKSYLPGLKVMQLSSDQKPKNVLPEVDMQLFLGKDFKGLVSPGK
jgi:LCP family protein required for cell wall assembly